jgi:Luciferase
MPVSGAKEKIETALQDLAGIDAQPHRFGGTEYRLGRREIGHVHGDQLVDIPFPKEVRDALVAAGRAEPHHILPRSGWVSVFLRQPTDVDRAIELLKYSFEIAKDRKASYREGDLSGSGGKRHSYLLPVASPGMENTETTARLATPNRSPSGEMNMLFASGLGHGTSTAKTGS